MRIIHGDQYESKIYVIDEEKLITKIYCGCKDFEFRRKKKVNELADVKYFAEPCKHLSPGVKKLEEEGYILKRPIEMKGSDKLRPKLRKELLVIANNQCENFKGYTKCKETESLVVHRKMRGSNGGKYNKENCVVLCVKCHRARHAYEFK